MIGVQNSGLGVGPHPPGEVVERLPVSAHLELLGPQPILPGAAAILLRDDRVQRVGEAHDRFLPVRVVRHGERGGLRQVAAATILGGQQAANRDLVGHSGQRFLIIRDGLIAFSRLRGKLAELDQGEDRPGIDPQRQLQRRLSSLCSFRTFSRSRI